MSRKYTKSVGVTGLLIGLITTMVAVSGPANAQPFQYQPYEQRQYETKRPQRGYEGFPAPGVYCSYQRVPNRVCTYDKQGRERCKVKSWTLTQSCS